MLLFFCLIYNFLCNKAMSPKKASVDIITQEKFSNFELSLDPTKYFMPLIENRAYFAYRS